MSEQEDIGNLLSQQFYIWDILLLLQWVQSLRCDYDDYTSNVSRIGSQLN